MNAASEEAARSEEDLFPDVRETLLEVKDLAISFVQYSKGLRQRTVSPIVDLNLIVDVGEVVAVVGESGSGKSLLAHSILGILPSNARVTGEINYDGRALTPERVKELRGREITFVPQSVQFLNPLMRVGAQIPAKGKDKRERKKKVRSVFERYRLPAGTEKKFPYQLSGGMARRVLVASATVGGARLIVADEPTPGLDEAAIREALGHLRELADEGRAVMLISHDLEQALGISDRVAVFYAGTTLEEARADDFNGDGCDLRHPYTRALWKALPSNGFLAIPGNQPTPDNLPPGCLFSPRCQMATEECFSVKPHKRDLRGGWVRCHHAA
ncbi:MAG: ABC transporter ATP-binding protein [Actinobacteria bacterium]|nr:ABC transporter ATP-binding protein [Actinomycetota bacterium]